MQIEFNKAAIVRNKKLHGAGYVMQEKKDTKIGYIPSYMRGYISFYLSFSSRLSKFFRGFRQKFGGQLWGREKIKAKN
ncbi:hypothetical protein [[Clostridium] innocuum]|uniref:hypothetical protein n=1 Tax=Clostridium innocuum TaxID=1522 RepID=UPI001FCB81B8|nr:hypothetical protein [[Clostridium] innocuum]